MPLIAYTRWQKAHRKPNLKGLVERGIIGGVISNFSFGSIMMATRLGDVAQVAVVRETSTIFAALIGILFLNETLGFQRVIMILLIAGGAILVGIGV